MYTRFLAKSAAKVIVLCFTTNSNLQTANDTGKCESRNQDYNNSQDLHSQKDGEQDNQYNIQARDEDSDNEQEYLDNEQDEYIFG